MRHILKTAFTMIWGLTWLLVHQVAAQEVKINVYTAKSPQLGIDGGLTVKITGSLSSLNGLKYLETYKISDYIKDDDALALKPNAMGVIGNSTMMVDEYEVTADYKLLNVENCAKFFNELNDGNYYKFDDTTKTTTAFIGVHKKKWYVLLPKGYKVNQQVTGHGSVYANNTAFQGSSASDKTLITKQTGRCGIVWPSSSGTNQSIVVDFQEPPSAVPIAAGSLQNDPAKEVETTNSPTISGAPSPRMTEIGAISMVLLSVFVNAY